MKWIKFTEQLPPKNKEIVVAMRNRNMCEYGIWLYDICFYLGGDINDNNNWEAKTNWEHPIYWSFIECPE